MKKRFWKRKSQRAASDVLEDAMKQHETADYVTVGEMMNAMEERGFGLLMVIFVLPNCVPVPVPPGVSTILSVPLFFLAMQMVMQQEVPWLPSWLRRQKMKRSTLADIVSKAAPRLKRVEKLLRPRLSFASTAMGERVVGVLCMVFALSIAVPLPWTNFVPGVGILVMSLGLLSKDGVTILIGSAIGFVGVFLSMAVLFFGAAILQTLIFW